MTCHQILRKIPPFDTLTMGCNLILTKKSGLQNRQAAVGICLFTSAVAFNEFGRTLHKMGTNKELYYFDRIERELEQE